MSSLQSDLPVQLEMVEEAPARDVLDREPEARSAGGEGLAPRVDPKSIVDEGRHALHGLPVRCAAEQRRMRRAVMGTDPPRVLLLLGESRADTFDDLTLDAAESLGDDLVTIDPAGLEAVLVDVPIVIDDGDLLYRCFTGDHPKGKAITEAECERLRQKDVRAGYDLFIDLLDNKIWRKGRSHGTELKSNGQSNGKKLGQKSVQLLADYIKRPHHPMAPSVTPTYQGAAVEARSSSVRLSTVRRSIKGTRFLRNAAQGSEPGTGTYVFEPDDMSYCVVERIPHR